MPFGLRRRRHSRHTLSGRLGRAEAATGATGCHKTRSAGKNTRPQQTFKHRNGPGPQLCLELNNKNKPKCISHKRRPHRVRPEITPDPSRPTGQPSASPAAAAALSSRAGCASRPFCGRWDTPASCRRTSGRCRVRRGRSCSSAGPGTPDTWSADQPGRQRDVSRGLISPSAGTSEPTYSKTMAAAAPEHGHWT